MKTLGFIPSACVFVVSLEASADANYSGRGVAKDLVRAYVWKSLALDGALPTVTARKARVSRETVAAGLSQAQLAQAKARLDACRTNLDGCD